jgi:hypothetical protein
MLNLNPRANYTTNFITKRLDDKILAPFMESDQQRLESELLIRLLSAKQKSTLTEEYAINCGNRNMSFLKRYTRNDLHDRQDSQKSCWNRIPPILKTMDCEYSSKPDKILKKLRKEVDADCLKDSVSSYLSASTNSNAKRVRLMQRFYTARDFSQNEPKTSDIVVDDMMSEVTADIASTVTSSFITDFNRTKKMLSKRPINLKANANF